MKEIRKGLGYYCVTDRYGKFLVRTKITESETDMSLNYHQGDNVGNTIPVSHHFINRVSCFNPSGRCHRCWCLSFWILQDLDFFTHFGRMTYKLSYCDAHIWNYTLNNINPKSAIGSFKKLIPNLFLLANEDLVTWFRTYCCIIAPLIIMFSAYV